ncbi:MAG: type II secretion system protein [Candidatus Methylacidiphilales bacterium]|nr:type II secretion system protein [Candidatus Methylacidiphilales bacterium]
MKNIRRSKRGFTLVELMVVITIIGILAAVGTPAMMIALDRARKSADTQNIRQLGIALMASASASEDQRYPATSTTGTVATTSTDVFKNLLVLKEIPTADLVFSPGAAKVKFTGSDFTSLSTANVGYNYTKATIGTVDGGVSMSAEDTLPLLWSAGNTTLTYTQNAPLTLTSDGIWKTSGATVYYKGNNSTFKKATSSTGTTGTITSFISNTFQTTTGVTYAELKP